MSIAVFKPDINRRDMHSVLSCLVTDIIGPDQIASQLVNLLVDYFGCTSGCALREYGRAIEITVDALALKEGDRVLLSALAPGIYAKVFANRGIVPVFVDVEDFDVTMNAQLAEKMADDARALYIHSSLGMVPQMDALEALGLPIIEDVSESAGSRFGEVALGTVGHYVIMGMESRGIVTSGGGALLLARDTKSSRALKKTLERFFEDSFLSDINASLALVQWEKLERSLEKRRKIFDFYLKALSKGRHRTLVSRKEGNSIPFSFPVVLDEGMKDVRRYACREGVETLLAFAQCAISGYPDTDCLNARSMMTTTLLFPLYPALTSQETHKVARVLSTLP